MTTAAAGGPVVADNVASPPRKSRRPTLAAFLIVGTCLVVGGIGGLFTTSSVSTWYPTLIKPAWNPPNAVFGPVWTALYLMMGIAYWLVYRANGRFQLNRATTLFAVQLFLNLAWSGIFFGLRSPQWALLEIVFLLAAIILTALEFGKHSRLAAALLVPYLLWVSYATSLNAGIVWLNR